MLDSADIKARRRKTEILRTPVFQLFSNLGKFRIASAEKLLSGALA